jgi:prolyl-tRNA synthetase
LIKISSLLQDNEENFYIFGTYFIMEKLPTRQENYAEWYNELVLRADLAEHSQVRGCMVIKPYGYAIWENMKAELDFQFKETGHVNAYFPLFIPKSYLAKEAKHVDGFAKECAVVTHYRLKIDENGELVTDPEAKLEEELIVRPTSETIIWNSYKNWISSYRDLPILINQWANVVRWEMRTRLFLRTTEFLWQEGHTAHATAEEAIAEAEKMLGVYTQFVQDFMAIPVVQGRKSPAERFAGAEETYCIEAMMQDGKALQAGTSHFLGQNFAKAFEVKYMNKENKQEYVWATSWGVSTRLMGALIMTHADDKGLVIPPKIAPWQVVLVPIFKNQEQLAQIMVFVDELAKTLKQKGIRLKIDADDHKTPGWKFSEYEMKGVPIRLAVGMRDMENKTIELVRRDTGEKQSLAQADIVANIEKYLVEIQENMLVVAQNRLRENTVKVDNWQDFVQGLDNGKFLLAHWDGTEATEEKIKEMTKATIRCVPLNNPLEDGVCILTGKPSTQRVLFARAY